MPKYVYIQIHGAEKPARIEADKVEHKRAEDSNVVGDYILALSLGEAKVGEFKGPVVDGWWIQDE